MSRVGENWPLIGPYHFIGGQNYFRSGDGTLMPARKDQPPPDLRNFEQAAK